MPDSPIRKGGLASNERMSAKAIGEDERYKDINKRLRRLLADERKSLQQVYLRASLCVCSVWCIRNDLLLIFQTHPHKVRH